MPTVRVRIHGRVQGVGYRDWTAAEARRLGLAGWVRNRSDGTVEALFQGEAAAVEAMIERCRKGPALAAVESIERFPAESASAPGFTQAPSA